MGGMVRELDRAIGALSTIALGVGVLVVRRDGWLRFFGFSGWRKKLTRALGTSCASCCGTEAASGKSTTATTRRTYTSSGSWKLEIYLSIRWISHL